MKTPYDQSQADFSNAGHEMAKQLVYPKFFRNHITWDQDTLLENGKRGEVLDGEMAIDRIAHVGCGLKAPLSFTIQERFLRPSKYNHLTITEWSYNSNLPSELYKLSAQLFVCGIFDGRKFKDVIIVNLASLLLALAQRRVAYHTAINKSKNQTFLCIPFDEIENMGYAMYREKFGPQQQTIGGEWWVR